MRKALIILIVLSSVFLTIGCAGNQPAAPNETGTPVQTVAPTQAVTQVVNETPAATVTPISEQENASQTVNQTQTIDIDAQYPIVITPKLEECKDFYVKNFGFDIVFESDWYIQLKHKNGAELGFMKPNLSNQPKFLHPEYDGKGIILTFEVKNAAEEYEKAKKIGDLQIIFPYKEEEWGQKHFILEDPAGTFVDIVQQLA